MDRNKLRRLRKAAAKARARRADTVAEAVKADAAALRRGRRSGRTYSRGYHESRGVRTVVDIHHVGSAGPVVDRTTDAALAALVNGSKAADPGRGPMMPALPCPQGY